MKRKSHSHFSLQSHCIESYFFRLLQNRQNSAPILALQHFFCSLIHEIWEQHTLSVQLPLIFFYLEVLNIGELLCKSFFLAPYIISLHFNLSISAKRSSIWEKKIMLQRLTSDSQGMHYA